MPHFVKHLLAKVISLYLIYFPNQSARITRKNIQLAYPLMPKHQQHQLSNDSIEELSQKFFDLLTTWVKPVADSRERVTIVRGFSEFQQTTDGQPTLILLPHLGNWELFGLWLTQYRPYTAMFRPLRVPEISAFSFDLVISNPPYIPRHEIAVLAPEVASFDPVRALDGGGDGLASWRQVMPAIARHLASSGQAFVEIGAGQAPQVTPIAAAAGLQVTDMHADLGGIVRCLTLSHVS